MPLAWAAGISGGLGAIGSIIGGGQQAAGAGAAANANTAIYRDISGKENIYSGAGNAATHQLDYLLGTAKAGSGYGAASSAGGGFGSLLTPFTAQNFQQLSPAYDFQRQQGAQGVLNQDSTSQGALSGAAMKDLIGYNQGMANTSFNTAFNQYQTQQGNIYQRLAGIAGLGSSAASNSTTGGSSFGSNIGGALSAQGTALGGATVGAFNSLGAGGLGAAWLSQGASNGLGIPG